MLSRTPHASRLFARPTHSLLQQQQQRTLHCASAFLPVVSKPEPFRAIGDDGVPLHEHLAQDVPDELAVRMYKVASIMVRNLLSLPTCSDAR